MNRAVLALALLVPLAGCSLIAPVKDWMQPMADLAPQPPKPWEKGNLAKPEMTMGGDALDQRYTQHIYQSKEAAAGGGGVGGGGCGCN
jgi:Domain of unknown function (DUF4266)